jgi:hypothetical protein
LEASIAKTAYLHQRTLAIGERDKISSLSGDNFRIHLRRLELELQFVHSCFHIPNMLAFNDLFLLLVGKKLGQTIFWRSQRVKASAVFL